MDVGDEENTDGTGTNTERGHSFSALRPSPMAEKKVESNPILRPPPLAFLTQEGTFLQCCIMGGKVRGGQTLRQADVL